jgi:hypothetical protein
VNAGAVSRLGYGCFLPHPFHCAPIRSYDSAVQQITKKVLTFTNVGCKEGSPLRDITLIRNPPIIYNVPATRRNSDTEFRNFGSREAGSIDYEGVLLSP